MVYKAREEAPVLSYNLSDKNWTTIKAQGLAHLFNNDENEFTRRKKERQDNAEKDV